MTEQVEAPEAEAPEETGTDGALAAQPEAKEEKPKEVPAEPGGEPVAEGGTLITEPDEEEQDQEKEVKEDAEEESDESTEGEKDSEAKDESGKEGESEVKLKLPENSTLDPDHVDKVEAFAKAQGLSSEQAQALLERESESHASFVAEAEQTMEKTKAAWLEEVKADPVIGGENLNRSAELAKRVVKRFGSEQFIADLNKTGFGNHPGLVHFCFNVGNAMSEDQIVMGGAKTPTKKSIEETFYGKSERAQ